MLKSYSWMSQTQLGYQIFTLCAILAANIGARYETLVPSQGGCHSILQTLNLLFVKFYIYGVGFRRSPSPKWAAHVHANLILISTVALVGFTPCALNRPPTSMHAWAVDITFDKCCKRATATYSNVVSEGINYGKLSPPKH